MRNWMSGKRWADAVAKGKAEELLAYARRDSELCLRLWEYLSPRWPTQERILSGQTRALIWTGVNVDADGLRAGIATLKAAKDAAAAGIPWATGEPDAEPTLSLPVLRRYCDTVGVPPPASMAKDSEECAAWEDKFADKFPFIRAIREYRRTNMLLRKLEQMERRIRPDGTVPDEHDFFRHNPDQYLFMHRQVIPQLREMGATDADIAQLFVHNPRRFLAGA
jgi:hypothetical protein